MKSREYLEANKINPDNCMLYWLCDYTLKDWVKLPSEKRLEYEKLWNRKPPKRSAAGWGEESLSINDLRYLQDQEDMEIFREKYDQT